MRNKVVYFLCLIGTACHSQAPFITTWKTDNPGVSNSSSVTIPTKGEGYKYDIDWENDGIFDDFNVSGDATHDYRNRGQYQIVIRGDFPRIYFNNSGDRLKLLSIEQWGDISWENMNSAFEGCEHLEEKANDFPDLQRVGSMSEMFYRATNFTGDLSNWKVGDVNWMISTFKYARDFNSDISGWDVSNVNSIRHMFEGATTFNQDVSQWDISNVITMQHTFHDASSFNQNLGSWDINQVTDMTSMLDDCGMSRRNYNKALQGWASQSGLQTALTLGAAGLKYCKGEDARMVLTDSPNLWNIYGDSQDCTNTEFITTWITSNSGESDSSSITIPVGTSLSYNYDVDWNNDGFFEETGITGSAIHDFITPGTYTIRIRGEFPHIYFNNSGDKRKIIRIDQWGEIEWTSMDSSFYGADNMICVATDTPDLEHVTSISAIFSGARNFVGDLSNWNVSNVINMANAFSFCDSFNSDISEWNVGKVEDMSGMFKYAEIFNSDISVWDVINVENMSEFASYTDSFNVDISDWDVSNVSKMSAMFQSAKSFNQNINSWDVCNVTSMWRMFRSATNFNSDLDGWETLSLSSVSEMFKSAKSFNGDLNSWDMSRITSLEFMFQGTDSFNRDLSMWDVSNVTNANSMFRGSNFDQNIGDWDIESVIDMYLMFDNSNMSRINYDSTLIGWESQNVNNSVRLGAVAVDYCEGESARESLILNHNWNITGDLKDCGVFCTEITNSLIQLGSSDWNLHPSYWDEGVFPDSCHQVVISNHRTTTIGNGNEGKCFSIEIQNGSSLTVESGAELTVTGPN